MLVLTRKRDETIKIGSNVVIRVMKTRNGSVKLGIEAPSSVRVVRGELATLEPQVDASMFAPMEHALLESCELEAMFMQS